MAMDALTFFIRIEVQMPRQKQFFDSAHYSHQPVKKTVIKLIIVLDN